MAPVSNKWDNDEVVQRFREYLQIPSVHPDIDYEPCLTFLKRQAEEIGLKLAVNEYNKKPTVVLTWEGTKPQLPAMMFNSHMDVVPVYEEHWTYPPFEAAISEDGFIYARGTQDVKCLGMVWLEGIRRLKAAGKRLKRTVHVTFVPDEEIGGTDGMQAFTESEAFKKLNVGFALDESAPHVKPKYCIAFNVEKTCRQLKITCHGQPGHGSLMFPNGASDKIYYIIDKFMKTRGGELKKLSEGGWFGDVLTINLTQLMGGVQQNVIPENLSVVFDIRIPPSITVKDFDEMVQGWCKEAGKDVELEILKENPEVPPTAIDGSVPFWNIIDDYVTGINVTNKVLVVCTVTVIVNDFGYTLECKTCPGATDMRFVRVQGVPAINLSPFDNTPTLLHDHDERMHVDVYKKGVEVAEKLIEQLASHE